MRKLNPITWEEIFELWRSREETNPEWVKVATEIKGWENWESWRRHTATLLGAEKREWTLYQCEDPVMEIPAFLIGPYAGWQNRVDEKNKTSFEKLLDIPEQYNFFIKHGAIKSIQEGFPFATSLIGILREDTGEIVVIDGHHRAMAFAFAKRDGKKINFKNVPVVLALATLPKAECTLFDQLLLRGTDKIQKNKNE